MRRMFLVVVALVSLAACRDSSSAPVAPAPVPLASDMRAETSTQNDFVPLSQLVWVGCAAGGSGEFVQLEGKLHVLTHVTSDTAGGFHLVQHFQPQGISGTGATTGETYRGTGVTRWNTNLKVGLSETYVNNFRIIGRKRGNNYLVQERYHVTVNADGRVTTERFSFSVDCK